MAYKKSQFLTNKQQIDVKSPYLKAKILTKKELIIIQFFRMVLSFVNIFDH
jgi:hypothetical protein